MNCQKVQSLISAYLDGELGGQEMLAIRHHLVGCRDCSDEYESLLAIKRTFGRMSPKRPADDLALRIISRLDGVHVPFHVRMKAAVRNYFAAFPRGIRVGAAGIAVIAGLLMVRGGDVSVSPRIVGTPISLSTFERFAESGPELLTARAEASSEDMTIAYTVDSAPWRSASSARHLDYVSRTGGMILAEY